MNQLTRGLKERFTRRSRVGATEADLDRCWQSFLHRFDIEHTLRLFMQTLGWTKPRLRNTAAADRWTWLVIAASAQLQLARALAGNPAWLMTAAQLRGTTDVRSDGIRRRPAGGCSAPKSFVAHRPDP
ncbi:hypothetical protein [Streptomyces pristinaespiralis]|uniref:hypothetical protein n=1 Tax=Streptomyces pristinaespiralis TaxID=38300 RepID=UPI003F4D1BC5